jgi:hypothetical protein
VAIRRWQAFTGRDAIHDGGLSFDEIAAERTGGVTTALGNKGAP